MTAPHAATQKLATAKTWQNTGSNLADFQTWLGNVPNDAFQYAGQPYAVAGNNPGVVFIRQPGIPIIALNNTDWLVVPDDSTGSWYKQTAQDYTRSWV